MKTRLFVITAFILVLFYNGLQTFDLGLSVIGKHQERLESIDNTINE